MPRTTDKNQPETASLASLPLETRRVISSHVGRSDILNLALVSRCWLDPAEEILWRDVPVDFAILNMTMRRGLSYESVISSYLERGTKEELERREAAELRMDFEAVWTKLVRALLSRPSRATYIRTLRLITNRSVVIPVRALMKTVAPTLVYLCHSTVGDPNECVLVPVIHEVGRFDGLRASTINRGHRPKWEKDAVSMLNNMPNLEDLDLFAVASGFDQIPTQLPTTVPDTRKRGSAARGRLRQLPNLRSLKVDIEPWHNVYFVDRVLELGPNITRLDWTHVTLKQDWRTRASPYDILESQPRRWPKLRSFHVEADDLVEAQFTHDKIEALTILSPSTSTGHYVGTTASPYVDGRLSTLLANMVIDLPSLVSLTICSKPITTNAADFAQVVADDEAGEDRPIHFRVFESDSGDRLILARFILNLPIEHSVLVLRPHACSYNHDVLMDLETFRRPTVTSTLRAGVWCSLSDYHGWPLPKCLLSWLEQGIGLDDSGMTGARGLSLPDHVWTVLQGWREELESRDTTQIGHMDRNDFEPLAASEAVEDDDYYDDDGGDFHQINYYENLFLPGRDR